jgi:hypothetical protein
MLKNCNKDGTSTVDTVFQMQSSRWAFGRCQDFETREMIGCGKLALLPVHNKLLPTRIGSLLTRRLDKMSHSTGTAGKTPFLLGSVERDCRSGACTTFPTSPRLESKCPNVANATL